MHCTMYSPTHIDVRFIHNLGNKLSLARLSAIVPSRRSCYMCKKYTYIFEKLMNQLGKLIVEFSKFSLNPCFETQQFENKKITNCTQLTILINNDLLIKHTENAIQRVGYIPTTYEIAV